MASRLAVAPSGAIVLLPLGALAMLLASSGSSFLAEDVVGMAAPRGSQGGPAVGRPDCQALSATVVQLRDLLAAKERQVQHLQRQLAAAARTGRALAAAVGADHSRTGGADAANLTLCSYVLEKLSNSTAEAVGPERLEDAWSWKCEGWDCVKTANGPVYIIGQCFLLYAGFLADTLFIRITLVLGALSVCLWNLLGTPQFPYIFNGSLPGIKVDAIVFGVLGLLVNGTPAVRQLLQNDAKVEFAAEDRAEKETMWRIWHRRTGISRADFNLVLGAGEFVVLEPGARLPMLSSELQGAPEAEGVSSSDSPPSGPPGEVGDLYYYVAGGRLDGCAFYPEGNVKFEALPGQFVDVFALLSLLGHTPVAFALQSGPPELRVAAASTYSRSLRPPRWCDAGLSRCPSLEPSAPGGGSEGAEAERQDDVQEDVHEPGALLFRWRRKDLVKKVFGTPSFAPDAMRLAVGQSATDTMFRKWMDAAGFEGHRRAFLAADAASRRINAGPLPRDAATLKRSFLQQWWLSNKGWPWRITPQERAVNAVRCGSRELQRAEEMRRDRSAAAAMRRAASGATQDLNGASGGEACLT